MHELGLVTLLALLVTAAVTDLKSHRIPNVISLGGIGLGILFQITVTGSSALLLGLGGVVLAFAVFVIPYALRVMAAGDVKLMMMVGSFLGWQQTLEAALITLMVGGLLGFAYLGARGGLVAWFQRYSVMLFALAAGRPSYVTPRETEAAAAPFPYAVAILSGVLVTLWRAQFL
jgi:prepilin peptidase CpaA